MLNHDDLEFVERPSFRLEFMCVCTRLCESVCVHMPPSLHLHTGGPVDGRLGDTQGRWLAGEENRLESRGPAGRTAAVCVPSL